jgi:alpha-L-fucosidase
VLPLWPVSDAGLRIAAHLYNKSIRKSGKLNAVVCGKILDAQQRKCMVWDIERGQSNAIEPLPWQTDTCLGQWHYDRRVYDNNHYKSAKTVIHTLVDIISKNGNLMLNVPLRGDGSIDDKELAIVEGIGKWIAINGEGVYGTRPWKVFGEGPAIESAAPLSAQGFNEGKGKPFGPADIRFVVKGKTLYATLLGWPTDNTAMVKTLKAGAHGKVEKVSLLGHGKKLDFKQTADGLKVSLPEQPIGDIAFVLKLEGTFV